MAELPTGTVTLLFTDIEGSTRLLRRVGDAYADLLAEHRRLLAEAFGQHRGSIVDSEGDAFFVAFASARDAIAGAEAAQRALAEHPWPGDEELRVRMGLHTGEPTVGDEGYVGLDVVRAARICSAGHGGQILVSETTRALVGNELPDGVNVRDLGQQNLKDIQHEHVYELSLEASPLEFPPPKQAEADRQGDELANRFNDRINRYVEQQLEAAFDTLGKPEGPRPRWPWRRSPKT